MSDDPAGVAVSPSGAPNLLVIMADQFAAHLLDDPDTDLPHLRRLRSESLDFAEAHCAFPLCVPSRASLLTGRTPHELGFTGNAAPPGVFVPVLGHHLRDHGYLTGWAGKWHCPAPEIGPDDGFETVSAFGDRGLVEQALGWLDEATRPFCLVVSFDDPHTICEYARGQEMPYGPVPVAEVLDCPPLPANHVPGPYDPEAIRYEQTAAASMYGTIDYGPDDWRRYRHAYRRLAERFDAAVGALLAGLDERGLTAATQVIVTSDHGDGDAAHRWNQKLALFPEVTRVPFLVRVADGTAHRPASRRPEPVNTGLDLLPTVCALVGCPPPAGLRGIDLLPVAAGQDDGSSPPREVVVETTLGGGGRGTPPTHGRMLVAREGTYVVYGWGRSRERLFAPGDHLHQRNLAVERRHETLLNSLRRRLFDWCTTTGDPFAKKLVFPPDVTDAERARVFERPY